MSEANSRPMVTTGFVVVFGLFLVVPGVWQLVTRSAAADGTVPLARTALGVFAQVERSITESAPLTQLLRPRWQQLLYKWLREGNGRVYVAEEGTLYYRPGIQAFTGPGPLRDAPRSVARPQPEDVWVPPQKAIRIFASELRARGIRLLLVPIPDKAALLRSQSESIEQTLLPRDAAAFYDGLQEAGVEVISLHPQFFEPGTLVYMEKDTHWNGAGALRAAKEIASNIQAKEVVFSGKGELLRRETRKGLGDLIAMLGINNNREAVEVFVPTPPQHETRPRIVWLGDSFTNIFRDAALGFGEGAGVAELTEFLLDEPLLVVARNGGGSTAVRRELARLLAQGIRPEIVIWALAERDLFLGESLSQSLDVRWEIVPLPQERVMESEKRGEEAEVGRKWVTAEIVRVPTVPNPAAAPYADCLVVVEYLSEEGEQLLVVHSAFEDRQLKPAATFRPGQKHRIALRPFQELPATLRSRQIVDASEDFFAERWWAEEWNAVPSGRSDF